MATVYSTLLAFAAVSPTSLTDVFTVPVDTTCVIREINYQNYSGVTALLTVQGRVSGSQAIIAAVSQGSAGVTAQWTGRMVLPAGSVIEVVAGEANFAWSISGYLLAD